VARRDLLPYVVPGASSACLLAPRVSSNLLVYSSFTTGWRRWRAFECWRTLRCRVFSSCPSLTGLLEEMQSLLNMCLAHIRPQHALSEQLVGDTKTVPESLESPARKALFSLNHFFRLNQVVLPLQCARCLVACAHGADKRVLPQQSWPHAWVMTRMVGKRTDTTSMLRKGTDTSAHMRQGLASTGG